MTPILNFWLLCVVENSLKKWKANSLSMNVKVCIMNKIVWKWSTPTTPTSQHAVRPQDTLFLRLKIILLSQTAYIIVKITVKHEVTISCTKIHSSQKIWSKYKTVYEKCPCTSKLCTSRRYCTFIFTQIKRNWNYFKNVYNFFQ